MSGKPRDNYASQEQVAAAGRLALATHGPALRELARRDAGISEPDREEREVSYARFYVDMPVDRVDLVARMLNAMGVAFDAELNMVALPREHILHGIMNGGVGDTVIDAINQKMADQSLPNRIVRTFSDMTHEQRYALLVLGTRHADWDNDEQLELEEVDAVEWRRFLERYPEITA